MGSGPERVATWRGWAAGGGNGAHEVTSARLSGEARPRNRLFPKTRSWFALDAPLELLSPLSVLRVLFAVATLAWPIIGWIGRSDHGSRMAAVVAVSVTNTLLWVGLLAVKKVDLRVCRLLSAWWTVAVGVLVWSGGGTAASLGFAMFTVPIAVFVALYLGNRAVLVDLLGTAAVLGTALAPSEGVARALLLAGFGGVALATAPAAVLVLARSARRHDTVDPDTGLPNGFGLAQRLEARDGTPFVVAAVVLEGIGNAREALGYQVGTELLRRAVEDLGQVLPSDAVIGRVDGDELLVVVGLRSGGVDPPPSSTGPDRVGVPGPAAREGSQLADTLVRAVSAGRYLVGAIEVSLRAHVGLSTAPFDGTDVAELVRRASVTARRAAERGVAVQSWDGDQGALTADDLSLLGDLRLAPERGELYLTYQPQVARSTGRARSVEALLRWDSPVHGLVSPGRFIPLAERTGLVDRLTEWVMREALDAQVRWREAGMDLPVSVNVSPKSLPMPGLSSSILDLLAERDLPASCLTVEVTETAVADPEQAASVLRPLYDHGIRISVDDFGTGFTSLAALPTLPLDELKVDQCFVMRSPNSPADRAIVRTVGELGHRLGLEVVAEGVETAEIAGLLGDMGIDLLQGYHFARPLPEDELLRFMADEAQSGPASPPAGSAIPATPATPATPAAPARMITRVPVDGADHRVGHPTLG